MGWPLIGFLCALGILSYFSWWIIRESFYIIAYRGGDWIENILTLFIIIVLGFAWYFLILYKPFEIIITMH